MKVRALIFIFSLLLVGLCADIHAQVKTGDGRDVQKILLNGKEYYLHIIQKGEGLYRISVNYGVSQQEILDANEDISESLKVGQILRIPVISGRNTSEGELDQSRTFFYHTVEKGHTAYFVSRKYDVPIEVVYENNPGTEDGLIVGAILRIPVERKVPLDQVSAQVTRQPAIIEPQKDSKYAYYTIKPGDTLYSLARQYLVSVETIVEANPALRSGVLLPESEIRIPKTDFVADTTRRADSEVGFIQSGDFLYHSIVPGQTFFSISRLYQISVEELRAANPGVSQDDLKVGYMLRIPREDVEDDVAQIEQDDSRLFKTHRVRRRETLYGISRHYHVDIEVIKKVNPNVNFKDLDNGTRLKIPTDAWFSNQTIRALAGTKDSVAFPVPKDQTYVLPTDCSRNSVLGYREPIRVALMLPFGANEVRSGSFSGDSLQLSRDARMSTARAKLFTEFYSGVLLALDTLKQRGINIDLSVYDIAPDSVALKRVLQDPSLKEMHLIIGPSLAHELPLVSAFSREHHIPLVYPLSNTNPELEFNPYLFHVNTPDFMVFDEMADEIVKQAAGGQLLVILPTQAEEQATDFIRLIKQKAGATGFGSQRVQYVEYTPGNNDLVELQSLMAGDKPNFVVVPSVQTSEVSRIVPILYGVREKSKANITFFGLSDVLRFQTVDPEQIHALNGTFFRSFGLDYRDRSTNSFIHKYRQWFKTEPHAISPYFQNSDASSNYSRYGIWGYDVTHYFLSAIVEYGEDFDLCIDAFNHQQVQFNFNFERVSNWGGFYNSGLYMFRFRPDLRMERIKVVGKE
jgi:LysM repeat protein